VNYRTDLLNLRTAWKLKLPYLTERQKKKILPTRQPPGKTTTELLLQYQHQDWMLEE
jgi:hypothetical protein